MNLEDDILIERYLRNELSEEENNSFVVRLEEDTVFKEAYLLEKQLFESLNEESWSFAENISTEELNEYEALYKSSEISTIKEAIQQASKVKKNKKSKVIAAISGFAAAVALILVLNVFLKNDVNTKQLYADNFNIKDIPSFVTRSDTNNNALIDAEKLFKAQRYEDALTIFTISLEEQNNSAVYIYKAISEIELNKLDEAKTTLKTLINSDLIDAEKGYWYTGLLHLKSDHIKEAKKVFQKIVAENLYRAEAAKKILDEL